MTVGKALGSLFFHVDKGDNTFRLSVWIRQNKVYSKNSTTGSHLYFQLDCAKGKTDLRSCLGTRVLTLFMKGRYRHIPEMCVVPQCPREATIGLGLFLIQNSPLPPWSHWRSTLKTTQTFIPEQICLLGMVARGSSCPVIRYYSSTKSHIKEKVQVSDTGMDWHYSIPCHDLGWWDKASQDKEPKH